jgi:glycosyltransferase involved in cell wall biosynthesis
MSYAVPVVASILHGGTREIIANDGMGILLESHDVQKMSDVLVHMAEDTRYREVLGECGRLRILECASPRKNAEATLQAMGLV